VGSWIKRHIQKKHEPVSVSSDYGSRFQAWWKAIQPSWRLTSSTSLSRDVPANSAKETWAGLKKGGSAGLYVVVMALSWWIASLKGDLGDSRVYETVNDIAWVLSLVKVTTPPVSPFMDAKRPLSDVIDNEEPEKPASK
jgi:hypothetical protein